MSVTASRLRRAPVRRVLYGSLIAGAAGVAAACGSSSTGTSGSPSHAASPVSGASAAVTISAKSVPGVGTVLVNGQGRTLYMLTSEKGGKITCTSASGCTNVWPAAELPAGVTSAKAGGGVQPSLLGTAKGEGGRLRVTYNHWPLYTYSGDSAPGQAHGQGIVSFGGTWYVLRATGAPATGISHPGSSPSPGGGGYGY